MKSSFVLVGIIMVYLVIGTIAAETGLTAPVAEIDQFSATSPSESGGFWGSLSGFIAPLGWAFAAVGGLFQLATYQVDGIPPAINTLILAPMGLLLVFAGIKFVRGIGD